MLVYPKEGENRVINRVREKGLGNACSVPTSIKEKREGKHPQVERKNLSGKGIGGYHWNAADKVPGESSSSHYWVMITSWGVGTERWRL